MFLWWSAIAYAMDHMEAGTSACSMCRILLIFKRRPSGEPRLAGTAIFSEVVSAILQTFRTLDEYSQQLAKGAPKHQKKVGPSVDCDETTLHRIDRGFTKKRFWLVKEVRLRK